MTTRTNTRSSQLRENNIKAETDYTFEEPNQLEIPKAIEERFASEGISLGWIRLTIKGQEDYAHIGRKMQEGWQFVNSEEVPEMGTTSIVRDEGRYKGAVCRGDLALGKIPTFKLQAKKDHYVKQSKEMMDAVNSQLMRQSNSTMPISNTSKSSVTKGRVPTFQE